MCWSHTFYFLILFCVLFRKENFEIKIYHGYNYNYDIFNFALHVINQQTDIDIKTLLEAFTF